MFVKESLKAVSSNTKTEMFLGLACIGLAMNPTFSCGKLNFRLLSISSRASKWNELLARLENLKKPSLSLFAK